MSQVIADLSEILIGEEEGRTSHAYKDERGFLTIGIGCLIDPAVKSDGLCAAAISAQFAHDSAKAVAQASLLAGFNDCNGVRQAVLISMCFQLGDLHAWPTLKSALALGRYEAAADAMLDSKWARADTPTRAKRAAWMMREGVWLAHGAAIPSPLES